MSSPGKVLPVLCFTDYPVNRAVGKNYDKMMRMISRKEATCALVALVLNFCAAQQSEKPPAQTDAETGLIDGTVVYEDGRPTKGATVIAMPLGQPLATLIPRAETDENGYFSIHPLWLVTYAVGAKKEDEGYPDTTMQFYNDHTFERVTLTRDHLAATIAIRPGRRQAFCSGPWLTR